MTIKTSTALTKALSHLRTFAAEQLATPEPINVVKVTAEQAEVLFADFSTTLSDGTVRGVTSGDYEAVGNFNRDLHTATRVLTAEAGTPYLNENEEEDSLKLTFEMPKIGGHDLTVTSAVYRPGAEEDLSQDYTAVTRKWAVSDDDKEVDAYLADLSSKLKAKKK